MKIDDIDVSITPKKEFFMAEISKYLPISKTNNGYESASFPEIDFFQCYYYLPIINYKVGAGIVNQNPT